ncbi:hypothetical protein BX616_005664, partial [Lobosporangium transversale]
NMSGEVYQEVFDEEEITEDFGDMIIVDSSEWDTELDRVINQEHIEAVILEPEVVDLCQGIGSVFNFEEECESEEERLVDNRKRFRKN